MNRPEWMEGLVIVEELDARPLLAQGVHPAERVLASLATLGTGQGFDLLAPFVPGPLMERAQAAGCVAWSRQEGPGLVRTTFKKG